MKFILLILLLFYTATVMAAPGAISLNRSFKRGGGSNQSPCVGCPCDSFTGHYQCVNNGCCCDQTTPALPPATPPKPVLPRPTKPPMASVFSKRDNQIPCVECPCDGFSGDCYCVNNGCCCDSTSPVLPPEDGW